MFDFPQKVLFKHCDPAGIVFFPRYFEMINDCVEAFFDQIGFPFSTLHRTHAVPTAQIETTFHAPSRHGDVLALRLCLTRIGRSSITLRIAVMAGDDPRMTYTATLVHIDADGASTPWPAAMRSAFAPYQKEQS